MRSGQYNEKKQEPSLLDLLTINTLIERGQRHLQTDEPEKALQNFKLAAQQGNGYQPALSEIYKMGVGAREKKDYKSAITYFHIAAEEFKYSHAQNALGGIYSEGRIAQKNEEKSLRFFRLAANQEQLMAIKQLNIKHDAVMRAYAKKEDIKPDDADRICHLTLYSQDSIMLRLFNVLAEQCPEKVWTFFEKNPDDLWKINIQDNNMLNPILQDLVTTDKAVYSLITTKIEILGLTRYLPRNLSTLVIGYLYFQDDFEKKAERYYSSCVQTLFVNQQKKQGQREKEDEASAALITKQEMREEYGHEVIELTTFSCQKTFFK